MAHRPARQFMLDLETLDLGPRATPWQLSIVEFVLHADGAAVPLGNDFTLMIPPALASYTHRDVGTDYNTTVSDSTIEWTRAQGTDGFDEWLDQFNRCKILTAGEPRDAMMQVATGLQRLGIDQQSQMWAKGADFDFPIFEYFMRAAAGPIWKPPYHYRNKNCLRTFINEAARWGFETPKPNPKHVAYQDCLDQITLLSDVRSRLVNQIWGIAR